MWRDCAYCGQPFWRERRRGRPEVVCSDECRKARGSHGDVRLTRGASYGTGVITVVEPQERHTRRSPRGQRAADPLREIFANGGYVPVKAQKRRTADNVTADDKDYGLPAADPSEGRTGARVIRVMGTTLAHDWQEHPRPVCLTCEVKRAVTVADNYEVVRAEG